MTKTRLDYSDEIGQLLSVDDNLNKAVARLRDNQPLPETPLEVLPANKAQAGNAINEDLGTSNVRPAPIASRHVRQTKKRSSGTVESTGALINAVVPITTRYQQATAEALRRASLERKLAGQTPSSQQEIVELSVASWLSENGYLNDSS